MVLDAWSGKIVGWAMATHLRAEWVVDVLEMAVGQRRPGDVIHHSDQGSQHTPFAFGKRCEEAGVRPGIEVAPFQWTVCVLAGYASVSIFCISAS